MSFIWLNIDIHLVYIEYLCHELLSYHVLYILYCDDLPKKFSSTMFLEID